MATRAAGVFGALVLSLAVTDDASAQNLISNGSFESNSFSNWTTVPAPVGSNFGVNGIHHGGDYGAFFAGAVGGYDSIRQTCPTVVGHKYVIDFWVANPVLGGDSLQVYWEGALVSDQTPCSVPADGLFHEVVLLVTATMAGSQLRFDAYDAASFIQLDDISVTEVRPLVTNGGFEDVDFDGWVVVSEGEGTGFAPYTPPNPGFAHSGAWSAFIGSNFGEYSSLKQTVATVAGRKYSIEFWLRNQGVGDDSLRLYWEGALAMDQTPCAVPDDGAWHKIVLILMAKLNGSELRFDAFDLDSYMYLDDIAVTEVIAPVTCSGDSNGDGVVNFADILNTLANFGAPCP